MSTRPYDSVIPIGAYALLSNSRVCALVSAGGSIDWLCLPEPHSDAVFWSILDRDRGGAWSVEIAGQRSAQRRYVPGTMSVETTLTGDTGALVITDAFMLGVGAGKEQTPDHELVREMRCVRGEIEVSVRFAPRPGFGRRRVRFKARRGWGVSVHAGRQSMLLASELALRISDDGCEATGSARLAMGESALMSLGQTGPGPGVWPMTGEDARRRLLGANRWWASWSRALAYPAGIDEARTGDGPDNDGMRRQVERSALTLRSMIYVPTGAILASPTTSLPEAPGGERNWDYRFCWIRDASYTMRALLNLGLDHEAEAFLAWLLNASRMTRPSLRVMYDVYGRRVPREKRLEHVRGYAGSRPVRTGNGARGQLQLDTYGAIMDAAWQHHEHGGALSNSAGRMLGGFVAFARDNWERPDNGIWEIRSGPRHHTLSKVMCWVAMERGLRLAREGVMKLDTGGIESQMERLRGRVVREGYNEKLGSYAATLGGDGLDASLLMLSIYGFEEPGSARMASTIDRVYERLGPGAALYRYRGADDGVGGGDESGRFGLCGFWGVEALAAAGRVDEARARYDELMGYANDVGLFSEEIDIEHNRALGNFPQAITHVGVINASCTLARAEQGERTPWRKGGAR